ncbi:MAG: thioredoxin [Tannerellaceae bacterium]|jgi:thioredoxin 1|nr:thioredoxin [Tannerellaceae bacterium]
MLLEVTNSNFDELRNSGKPLVLDFWAEWCGPCRMVSPLLESLAEQFAGEVVIGKLNVDEGENDSIVQKYLIRNIPTLLFFKDGELVDRFVGSAQRSVYESKIKALLN